MFFGPVHKVRVKSEGGLGVSLWDLGWFLCWTVDRVHCSHICGRFRQKAGYHGTTVKLLSSVRASNKLLGFVVPSVSAIPVCFNSRHTVRGIASCRTEEENTEYILYIPSHSGRCCTKNNEVNESKQLPTCPCCYNASDTLGAQNYHMTCGGQQCVQPISHCVGGVIPPD